MPMCCRTPFLFRISVRRAIEIQEYAILLYMKMTCPTDMVDEHGSIFLRWSSDDEVDQRPGRSTGILNRRF